VPITNQETIMQRHHTHTGGFTLVEVLISLALSAILLAAVATAFNASMVNYRENQAVFRAINSGRQALARMTTQLRNAGTDVNGVFVAVNPTEPNNRCTFFSADGQDITYEYRDPNLYLIDNDTENEYVLCENISNLEFRKVQTDDGMDVKSICITMTIQCGNREQTLSSAAVVRRNLGK
jgi:prepilin-type N-terminal cleavage/methylation domain-containing protein